MTYFVDTFRLVKIGFQSLLVLNLGTVLSGICNVNLVIFRPLFLIVFCRFDRKDNTIICIP